MDLFKTSNQMYSRLIFLEIQGIIFMIISDKMKQLKSMFPPGLEPGTFRVLGERDNHYTTETLFI